MSDQRGTDRPLAATGGSAPALRGGTEPAPLQRLFQFIEKLARGAFFGKVVVSFQNGKVSDIRIEQTKKLEDL